MNNVKLYLKDTANALKYGFAAAAVLSVLFFCGGFLFRGFTLYMAVSTWRSGMCIVSGLSLFLAAGMILTKQSLKIRVDSRWREKFKKMGYEAMICTVSISFILVSALADQIMRLL